MGGGIFSKKEAIQHGFRVTKAHFWFIISVFLVFAGVQAVRGVMGYFAGAPVGRSEVKELYADTAQGDAFYAHLKTAGYIDESGKVFSVLQRMLSADALSLPEQFEQDRDRIFSFLKRHTYRLPFPLPVYYFLLFGFWVMGVIMQIGSIKIGLSLSRGQNAVLSELFTHYTLFFKYIFASILAGLATLGGFILLIVPGIIIAIMLSQSEYLVVDKGLGPVAALRESRALTKGARWQLFVFGLVVLLVNLGGFLCLGIGLLFTIPASYIAGLFVYDQLAKGEVQPQTPA
jgi:uncharacterized membrane protein